MQEQILLTLIDVFCSDVNLLHALHIKRNNYFANRLVEISYELCFNVLVNFKIICVSNKIFSSLFHRNL